MVPNILIVDDEPTIRSLLAETLQSAGYTNIAMASNGYEALDIAREQVPALMFLDVNMSGLDGFTVCRELKRDPRTAKIHVTMLTGLGDVADLQRGIRAKADDYIIKPFKMIDIENKAHAALGDHPFGVGDQVVTESGTAGTVLQRVQIGNQAAYQVRAADGVVEVLTADQLRMAS